MMCIYYMIVTPKKIQSTGSLFFKVLPAPIFFGGLLNGRLPPLVDDPSGFFKKKRDGKSSYGKWCLG